ncbi:hypothetical protein IMZ48_42720 [Candidatus Bathyarchaeota archaeon]|nr:hypothetical protein [Candidatus Bathyarchaeota archaeon]
MFTQEPEDIRSSRIDTHIPPTPESVTIDTAASSPIDTHAHTHHHSEFHRPTPSRTSSFSSTRDESAMDSVRRSIHDLEPYQSVEDVHSPATSDAELSDSRSSVDSLNFSGSESGRRHSRVFADEEEADEYFGTTQAPMEDDSLDLYSNDEDACGVYAPADAYDILNSETATPKPYAAQPSFPLADSKPTSLCHARPSRSTPSKECRGSRRTPEESGSRVQKPAGESRARLRVRGKVSEYLE